MSAELHKLLMETIISSSPEESKDNTNIVNGKTMIISLVLSPQTGTIHGRTRSALERPNEKNYNTYLEWFWRISFWSILVKGYMWSVLCADGNYSRGWWVRNRY